MLLHEKYDNLNKISDAAGQVVHIMNKFSLLAGDVDKGGLEACFQTRFCTVLVNDQTPQSGIGTNSKKGMSISMACNCMENKVWTFSDPEIDAALLEPTLEKYVGQKGSLITILQKAQDLYGYLPVDLLAYIAHRTGIKPAKVLGVVSFYTQFRTKPVGKNLILLCQGTACHVNGSAEIEEAIKEYLGVGEGEITPDGLFTYNNVACLGCCSLSPVMMVGEETYGTLTKGKVAGILKDIAARSGNEEGK